MIPEDRFVEAVRLQWERAGGDPAAVEPRIREMLDGISRGAGGAGGEASRLAADPLLLSLFFQNVDLLYEEGYEAADPVSIAVMDAVGRLEEKSRKGS